MARLLPFLLLFPVLSLAQPQGHVLWSYPCADGIYSTTPIQDRDGDTVPEIAAAIYYSAVPSDSKKVYCISGRTGDTLWVNRTAYGTWGNKGLATSQDLSGDGLQDVILGTSGTYIPPGRSCVAIDGSTGENLWVFPFGQERGWCYAVKPFVDVDGDRFPEVLAAAGGTTANRSGTAILLSGRTGDSLWAFRPPDDGAQCICQLGDVDADSVPDVAVGAGGNGFDNRVFCVSGRDGRELWFHQTGNSVKDVAPIRDVNNTGADDCVAGGWADTVFCLEGSDGSMVWAYDLGRIIMELVPVSDVNGDSIDDVVVGSWSSSVFVLSGADGAPLWSGVVGGDVWCVDTVTDVTGDGVPEVVAGCLGDGIGRVKVFGGTRGQELWYYEFSERVYDVTGVPDLNGNRLADVVVGLQDHGNQPDHLYAFDGLPPSCRRAEPGPVRLDSRMMTYNPRTGRLRLSAPAGVDYRLLLFDASGRSSGPGIRGQGGIEIEVPVGSDRLPLPSGTCFARLTLSSGHTETIKLDRLRTRS